MILMPTMPAEQKLLIRLAILLCAGWSLAGCPTDSKLNQGGNATGSTAATSVGSATLTWVAPAVNTDGSILNDLAGYRIHYGTDAGNLSQTVDIGGATATSYVVTNLTKGTYYFAVSAYSSLGTESAASNTASKTI